MIAPKLVPEAIATFAFLKSETGKKLLGPLAEQVGSALGDLGDIYRFYQRQNLEKIFTKWAESRSDKPSLSQEELRKTLPLLQLASVQSDDELQTRWAALLENTVNSRDGMLPSFGQTLSQLTPEEARFLDRLFAVVSQPHPNLPANRPGGRPLSHVNLIEVYDPEINTGINPAEYESFKTRMSEEQLKNYEKLKQAELVIQDLERLGIIDRVYNAEFDRYARFGDVKVPIQGREPILRSDYEFTEYGLSFIRAIRNPSTQ